MPIETSSIKNCIHVYANVRAILFTEETIMECINWFIPEFAERKLSKFIYDYDSYKAFYEIKFRYIDQTTDRVLSKNMYLVKEGDCFNTYPKEKFESIYMPDITTDPSTEDSGNSSPILSGNTFQIIANKAIKGITILGTGFSTGVEEFAHYIKINDINADAISTLSSDLGIYKWITTSNPEPTTTTTMELAKLIDNSDNTRTLVFGTEDDPKFTILYSLGANSRYFSMFNVDESFFLSSGSKVTIDYADGSTYTHTIVGSGTN